MRRYAAYHDSGLPWLGEVPSHWDLLKFKTLGQCARAEASEIRRNRCTRLKYVI